MNIKDAYIHVGPSGTNEKALLKDFAITAALITLTRAILNDAGTGDKTEIITIPTWNLSTTGNAASATKVKTIKTTAGNIYYPLFVDSNNDSATAETVYTNADIQFDAANASITAKKLIVTATMLGPSTKTGGLYYKNSTNEYCLIAQGSANLWIGANETTGTHHVGSIYISAGDGDAYISRLVNSARTNYKILDAGNYNSYSPTLTGTGASGTWGINITGSASRLSGTSSYTAWGKTYWSNGVPASVNGNIDPGDNVTSSCGTSSHAWLNVYTKNIISNSTLYLESAASTSILFKPLGTEVGRFNQHGKLILGLTDSSTVLANSVSDLMLYVNGATTITGTLTLSKTQDSSGTANNSPALIIGGPATGAHMEIDSNEIHAKTNGTTTAPLYLNTDGGLVYARGKALAEQNATTTSAGKLFVSTTTEGRGEWSTLTLTNLDSVYNWYSTMIASSDTDALINRWNEVVDFLNNFTEADTLASVLSTYVTLGTAQTITGAKTFANPISGDLLGNATTADRLKSTTAVGGAGTPVYFTGGLPVACTAANVRTFLGLGSVYSHAHTDYVTNVSYNSSTRMLLQSKGGATATDVVNVTNVYLSRANSTTSYRPLVYGKAGGTYNSTDLYADLTDQVYTSNTISAKSGPGYLYVAGNISINENPDTYGSTHKLFVNGATCIADAAYANQLEVWRKADNSFSCIRYSNGASTKTVLGSIGISAGSDNLVKPHRPYWSTGDATPVYYLLVHSTGKTQIGSGTQPVYIDANGQAQVCTAYSSASVNYATSSGQVRTQSRSTDAAHYLTFVDSNNSSATAETVYTDAGITYNPSTNLLTVEKLTASGVVNLSGATTIDSLTAGSLIVNGASSLTGNVSMGTVTAGTWNGSVIDVAHGGTGCSTLTSGSALIGNGTGDVTFRSITNNTSASAITANTNLITANTLAYWNGAYSGTSSRLAYCNKGAFETAATRAYATAIAVGTGTASASANNHTSDAFVPTTKAVYDFVTTTLAISPTISKASITKSLNSSTWTETGYTLYGESQGSYMLQITDTTTAAVFTGVFSIYHGSSATGNDLDEIPLHMCASATNKVRIYAATLNGKLLVSSQDTSATDHALTIKYKKIL